MLHLEKKPQAELCLFLRCYCICSLADAVVTSVPCKTCSSGEHCRKPLPDYCEAKPRLSLIAVGGVKAAESLFFSQYFSQTYGIYSKCAKKSAKIPVTKAKMAFLLSYLAFDSRKCRHAAVNCVVV